ncbi:phosphatidylinositol 3-kinase tor2 [Aulographum hederae CBS 113979]|uniref:Serine/threonine-protein kinase TOR n=1 Tax=Aulographum hederae CBS 113979 TaxID=1176131 RepID=A0A6G1H214_9PEZI|nr:phosphatidylinositol 3-kinase tor2 [Aulographum hederae CBS 113979]
MAASVSRDAIDRLFLELKSKNDDVRLRAAHTLRQNLDAAHRELTPATFQPLYSDITTRISHLIVQGSESSERIGGIRALTALIDFKGDDAGQKTTRFASYLRNVLRGSDTAAMVVAASALGQLATPGGTLTAELVESEVKSALEWLQVERQENRRFAAVLVLRELARNSPTLLFVWIPQIFEFIWSALRDPKVLIREAAAQAVSSCFEIIASRDSQMRKAWFTRVYDEVLNGFKVGTVEAIHGSLLTLKELLQKGHMFMDGQRYKESCEMVLKYKDSREMLIKREVLNILPILALYSPADFSGTYLHTVMLHLNGLFKSRKQEDRSAAFVCAGKVARATMSMILPWLDNILIAIRDGLAQKYKDKTSVDEAPIFECLSMLAIAVGQPLSKHIKSLLPAMFACGLSPQLTQALVDMAHYIPPSKPVIQEKLLDLLSNVLCNRDFQPLGSPFLSNGAAQIWTRDHKDKQTIEIREAEVALALHTLGSFSFEGYILNEFVRDVAIRYVDADNPEIRRAAGLTCCQLFTQDPIIKQTSNHSMQVVGDVISKLLTVGVADPDPEIRCTILLSLDSRFDQHLGKAQNIRTLFLALNDEKFEIREAAMAIIGRLTAVNPAHVFPSLRKVLIQLLTEIEYSNSPRSKEESSKLISHLALSSTALIKSYVPAIVEVLLPKASDNNPEVASTTLQALGNICNIGGEDMKPYVPQLMVIIIDSLQDLSTDSKRIAALRTLGQLAKGAGYVIEPYKDYPELLLILKNIVKGEPPGILRAEAVKLMGTLGALDPDEHQKITEQSPESNLVAEANTMTDVSLIMNGTTPSNEDYYPTVVINTLMGLLKDNSLAQYHSNVIEAVMNIYATMGLKCVPFLKDVVPGFITVIRTAPQGRVEGYFNQLSQLVRIVRQHIRPFLPSILETVQDYWTNSPNLQSTILSLIEAIARSLEGEFKVYLAGVLPLMLGVLDSDVSTKRLPSERVLHAFLIFGASAEEYMHLIVPVILRMFEKQGQPQHIRKQAIETLGRLSRQVNMSEFAAKMIHPLSRVLDGNDMALRQTAIEALSALIYQLGQDYIHFIPTVGKILQRNKIPHANYARIVSKLQKGEPLPQDLSPDEQYGDDDEEYNIAEIATKKLAVNQQHLKNAWEASQRSTREDWIEWMRRFSVELLRESPQQALRACTPLASIYGPIARSLFNSAFVSCWTELYDQYQEELVRAIETAITSAEIPPEILQMLLNLAEFMEHDDKALPIDVRILGMYAAKCHAFAKALHYKELEFNAEQNPNAVEALISINNQLQQYDAAFGILRKAQGYSDVELKETWFEKLFRWDEALASYQKREKEDGETLDTTMGKMRCLHALGEWEILSNLAQDKWIHAPSEYRKNIAPLAAAAAWGLERWELMDNYLSVMKPTSPDKSFFSAALAIQYDNYADAHNHIDTARGLLETELTALLSESYDRAYLQILRVQMLAELEEIIEYKQEKQNPEKQATMRSTWMRRLKGCQPNPEVWQRMLKVRTLVLSAKDDSQAWIKFANLCRKNARMGLAEKALHDLLGTRERISDFVRDHGTEIPYPIAYAAHKYMWSIGDRLDAFDTLKEFSTRVADDLQVRTRDLNVNNNNMLSSLTHANTTPELRDVGEDYKLLSKCYLKQGDWLTQLNNGEWDHDQVADVLASYQAATRYNKDWYKAWHSWALANFEVVTSMTSKGGQEATDLPPHAIHDHAVPAIQGFFKSIALSSTSSLQDTLRLLTLWFAHGSHPQVNAAVNEGISTVTVDTWLEVIPQLLARINQSNPRVRASIHKLLSDVGRAHPQALVFPLTVSMKSDRSSARSRSATELMDTMRHHSPALVDQADLVSHELIRIAVLWHELWHEGLEEASRLYFGDHNIDGMFQTLAPLHAMLDHGPETLREVSFMQSFGRELNDARDWCNTYRTSGEPGDLNQAWDLYYQVFRKIARQLPSLMTLEMQYVSPKLKEVHDLELALPGTYKSGKPVVRIQSFDPVSTVIQSKQRPRQLVLRGSDGNSYMYLLKGHEDIRQDERVMQLFGLCNMLLNNDNECRKRHLSIQKFSAIPLSTQSGLLGWVPNSDTLHVLIREYRESRKILLNIEHRIMLQMAPDYDSLTLMQKVEVFGYALDNTTGQDLYRVLWLKSKSSEAWLGRRTSYTRSLAVMSMVGYILGLGDRHPSNLMLDKITGKIVHIDFGDCFEVAMHREKYPERVPFRLTRMLTYAMEVSNIEGSYRTTCEHVMRVLRQNKESVMAVLEAFIHDPLLTWRLNNRESPPEPKSFRSERRASIIGVDANQVPAGLMDRGAHGINNGAQNPTTNGVPTTNGAMASVVGGDRPESFRPRRSSAFTGAPGNRQAEQEAKETQNARALQVLARVKEKLTGRDFKRTPMPAEPGNPNSNPNSELPNNVINHNSNANTSASNLNTAGNVNNANSNNAMLARVSGVLSLEGATDAAAQVSEEEQRLRKGNEDLGVEMQVDKLIREATNLENLCQHYIGWCSFW